MDIQAMIIRNLAKNAHVFHALLNETTREEYLYKPDENSWCMLEVLCHLVDEEVEDFRTRVKIVLYSPDQPLPKINPKAWVTERRYLDRDFGKTAEDLITERKSSISWLQSLKSPEWLRPYEHPVLGMVSAAFFLENWLAHDYLHIRQITRLRYQYLQHTAENPLKYAGNW